MIVHPVIVVAVAVAVTVTVVVTVAVAMAATAACGCYGLGSGGVVGVVMVVSSSTWTSCPRVLCLPGPCWPSWTVLDFLGPCSLDLPGLS